MLRVSERSPQLLIALGTLLLGLVLRAQYFTFESADYQYFLVNWVMHIRESILLEAYGTGLNHYNYTPLYSYFLGMFDFYFPNLYPLYTIKLVTFIGEIVAAICACHIMKLYNAPRSLLPMLAVAALLLCPSVIANGSITGQCDIWLAAFMLASLYYAMRQKSSRAFFYAGLAFAFKPQSVFLAPFALVLMLRRDLNWKHLWIIPAVYIATCIPCWLEGRPFLDLLGIYWVQVRGHQLSYNAANPYLYLNDSPDIEWVIKAGVAAAAFIAASLAWITHTRWKAPITPLSCLLLATLFAAVMPFVLPLMHDRYFFMADIFSLLLACMKPRWFLPAALLQSASLIAMPGTQFPAITGSVGWVRSLGMDSAVLMNAAAIAILLWLCYRNLWRREANGVS